jgi:hypothetical protein
MSLCPNVLALKENAFFMPGFWEQLCANLSLIDHVIFTGAACRLMSPELGQLISYQEFKAVIVKASSLEAKALADRVGTMAWYGFPGEIIFHTKSQQFLQIIEAYYEAESTEESLGHFTGFNRNLQICIQMMDLSGFYWCFTWDADFALLMQKP